MNRNEISIRDIFFYSFFAVMFGMRMWGIYEGKALYGPMLLLGFGLWGISFLMTEHSIFEVLISCVFMGLAGVIYLNSGEKGLLMYFALMVGMKGIDEGRLLKTGAAIGLAGMAVLTFLSSFGFIEDTAYVQVRGSLGYIFRRSLGFPHPNTLSSSFTILAMMVIILVGNKDKKRVWKTSALLFAIAMYLTFYSMSRTGLIITVGVLVLNLVYSYRNKLVLFEKICLSLIIPVVWIISVIVPIFAPVSFIERITEMDPQFGTRWSHARYYWDYNHLNFLGTRLNNPDGLVYGIDISQMYLLMNMGVIALVVMTVLWIMLIRDEIKENRIGELVITVSLLLMGIMDPFLYNIGFKNLAFIFMGRMLYKHLSQVETKVPEFLRHNLLFLPVGNRDVNVPNFSFKSVKQWRLWRTVGAAVLVIAAIVAVALFLITPKPEYVLADSNREEHIVIEDLEGSRYSSDDIREIEADGNIVLNYTDENELMYTYYSDEHEPVQGGFYAPNAGIVEKMRRSLSVVFWGFMLALFILSVRTADKRDIIV